MAGLDNAALSKQAEALYDEALGEIRANKLDSGCRKVELVERAAPQFYGVHNLLGVCAVTKGDFPAAESRFRRSIALNPRYVEAYVNLALFLLSQHRIREGRASLETALRLVPDDPRVLYHLGRAEAADRQFDRAIQHLRNAALLSPQNSDIRLAVAETLISTGKVEEARDVLQGMASAGDLNDRWNALLGYVEYKLGNPADAVRHLRRAIELAPRNEQHYLDMGEMLLFYNSDQAAISFFKAGLEQLPKSHLLHYGLGVSYWSHDAHPEEAVRELDTALGLRHDFAPALALLCQIHYWQKHWDLLKQTAARLMQVDANSALGYYYMALSELSSPGTGSTVRPPQPVRALLQTAIRLDPTFSDARLAFGKWLEQEGNWTAAIREVEEAVRIDPGSSDGLYRLARLYRETGQPEKSAEALERYKHLKSERKTDYEVLFRVVR
jgi:tetratricopeptide (TPR) repeat protein